MSHCPNCNAEIDAAIRVCPNCGAAIPPPPELTGYKGEPVVERTMTKYRWLDATLGILTFLATAWFWGVGYLICLILYFTIRGNYPVYARGMGWAMLISVAVLLGALAICTGLMVFGTH